MEKSNVKVEKVKMYDETDFEQMNIDAKYKIIINGLPVFVEMNDEPVRYFEAYEAALHELNGFIEGCNSYAEARAKIISSSNTLSEEKGYNIKEDTTGNYYGFMVKLYGNDKTETIHWDVRWY